MNVKGFVERILCFSLISGMRPSQGGQAIRAIRGFRGQLCNKTLEYWIKISQYIAVLNATGKFTTIDHCGWREVPTLSDVRTRTLDSRAYSDPKTHFFWWNLKKNSSRHATKQACLATQERGAQWQYHLCERYRDGYTWKSVFVISYSPCIC